jgi:hypothetical protein
VNDNNNHRHNNGVGEDRNDNSELIHGGGDGSHSILV